eukprot:2609695-Alexandrium_andersonii.AAC.1
MARVELHFTDFQWDFRRVQGLIGPKLLPRSRRAPSQPARGPDRGGLRPLGGPRGKSVGPQPRGDPFAEGTLQRREGK